jgi:OmpA-OmpF porin, OOP family
VSIRAALLVLFIVVVSGCATKREPRELYVILPEADGKAGAIVVMRGRDEILLQGAYSALSSTDAARFTANAEEIARIFGPALDATPLRPASYILLFIEGSDELTAEGMAEAERILAEIAERPVPEITIVGHTDTTGSDSLNDTLSIRRALRIRRELIARGVPAESILAVGRGRRELAVPTPANVREPRNRRVEISVR